MPGTSSRVQPQASEQPGVFNNALTDAFNPLELQGGVGSDYLTNRMRATVREIIRSYHQTYDHLQEAIQNAVDACEDRFCQPVENGDNYIPRIGVIVNLLSNEITIIDNGRGMDVETVTKYFFSPYASLKSGRILAGGRKFRGEKGVGATFLTYGSARLHLTTKSANASDFVSGEIRGGIEWVMDESGAVQIPMVTPASPHDAILGADSGTAVTFGLSQNTNLRQLTRHGLTPEDWGAILKLFTALGFVDFESRDPFLRALKASVTVIDEGGQRTTQPLTPGYYFPHEAPSTSAVDREALQRGVRGTLPISQRMKDCLYSFYSDEKLREILHHKLDTSNYHRFDAHKEELRANIERCKPRVYALFTWSNEFWDEVNQKVFRTRRKEFEHGIAVATRKQRVGEKFQIQFSYRTGDYNRFFLLIDMDNIAPDIGRKSLPEPTRRLADLITDSLHDDFTIWPDALRPAPQRRPEVEEMGNQETLQNALAGTDLVGARRLGVSLLKEPQEEQDVVALFFDLLGLGLLTGYELYAVNISQKYDGVAKFLVVKSPEVLYDSVSNPLGIAEELFNRDKKESITTFLEFKFDSDDFIRDVVRGEKTFRDVKWLVCWRIGTTYVAEGVSITNILDEQQRGHREFFGVTHLLTRDADSVFVICLQTIMPILASVRRSTQ